MEARTPDLTIKSRLLYHLSYWRIYIDIYEQLIRVYPHISDGIQFILSLLFHKYHSEHNSAEL